MSNFELPALPNVISLDDPVNDYVNRIFPYLEVSGNSYKNYFFIAVRFLNPVLFSQFGSTGLKTSEKRCVVVSSNSPLVKMDKSMLFFTTKRFSSLQWGLVEDKLLHNCFDLEFILHKTHNARMFYAVTTKNPFATLWKPTKKSIAFNALVKLFNSCVLNVVPFTAREAALLRHFQRNKREKNTFSSWIYLAMSMTRERMNLGFLHIADARFGKQIHTILKRSDNHVTPFNHPPTDFYECRLTLCDTEPVGIACCIYHSKTLYVSNMVMTHTILCFSDTQHVKIRCLNDFGNQYGGNETKCNFWFPLYKNRSTWENFGLEWYLKDRFDKCLKLVGILDWLSAQKADVYCNMKIDLLQVFEILTGMYKIRWD